MANGRTTSVPVYQIAELRFGDCILRDVEVVVFAKADRDILGLNALRRMQPFTLNFDDGRLTSTDCR
jgi:predicted aspartyl protease